MVAIFAGSGFGFERGSGSVLGGSGLLGSAVQGWGGEGVFVNAGTGNLLLAKQDEFLVGKGPDLGVGRTYNSLTSLADDNGDKWRQSTDRRVYGLSGTLNAAGSSVKRVSGDGTEITYVWDASVSAYVSKDGGGAYDRIVRSGSEWVWTDGDTQTQERYEITGTGRIKSVTDRNGSSLTFSYDGQGRLDKVTSADGAWIRYDYANTSSLNVTQVVTGYTDLATSTAKTLTRTRYGYDGSNRLTTVTVDLTPGDNSVGDGATYVTTYSYDGSGRISNVAQSDGSNLGVTYDGSSRVASLVQTESSGVTRTTSFTYNTLYTTITDPSGQVTRLDYDASGQLTKITAPPAWSGASQQIVQFAYNGAGDLTSTTDANGQVTTFSSFTANGLVQTVTDRLSNSITRTYSAANLLLSETRTGVDQSGSAVSLTSRFVYDTAGNLRFAISAEGRVTEYTRDAAGQVTYETVYAEAGYTTAGTPSESTMTSWVSGLADKSWVQKTKYLYDARGNATSVTTYGVANSSGTEQTSEGTSSTSFVYDQAGQLLSSWSGSNTATTYLYDGLGRVTSTTDANGGTTSLVYNAGSLTTTVTLASGYVATKTYNKAGDLVSVTDSGANTAGGTTTYAYDKLGRVRVRTDANGLKVYTIYDDAGRLVGTADHAGYLTEYVYDKTNRLVGTVQYRNAVSAGTLTTLNNPTTSVTMASLRPTADAQDISSWTVYDAEGRVLQTIAGDGSTTISTYDAAGRLQKTTAYVNKIGQSTVDGYIAAPPTTVTTPTANAGDTVARVFYDKDGLVVGSLSGEGYLSQNSYDKAGQLVATTSYAAATTAGLRASGSFTALLGSITPGTQDRTSRFVYDGQGLLRYTVDALGQVTRFDYDATGQKVRTAVYAAPLGATSDYTYDAVKSLATSLEASSAKREAWAIYDAAGRLAYAIAADGAVTGYSYDSSGRVTKAVQYEDSRATTSLPALATMDSWAAGNAGDAGNRITRTWYTARGEAAYSVDAEGYVSLTAYDAAGQPTSVKSWDGKITVADSATFTQVQSAITATGGAFALTSFEYDSLGRVTAEVDALGTRTTYAYLGATSLKSTVTRAANGTVQEQSTNSATYDHAGRAVQTVAAAGTSEAATSSQAFDGRGNLTSATDPRVKTTSYTYDLDGRVKTVTDAASGVTSYEYTAFGEVWKTTDPNGNASYVWYDALGRATTSRDAGNYLTTTAYTAFGEVQSVTRWMTATTGTPTMGTEPTGSGTNATTSFTYDARGRVLVSTDALSNTESYSYDAFGGRITSTNKLGAVTAYAYDKLGRLVRQGVQAATTNYTSATSAGTAGTYIVTTYEYTDARHTTMRQGYAAAALTGTVTALKTTTSAYDALGQLTTVTHDAVSVLADDLVTSVTSVPIEEYTYDRRGNVILAVTRGIDTGTSATRDAAATYSYYDDLDRKVAEIRQLTASTWVYTAHTYDGQGNLVSTKVYENNGASGTPALGGTAPTAPSGSYRETVFTYDSLNRMLTSSVVGAADAIVSGWWNGSAYVTNAGAGAAAQALTTSYLYDAGGNVVKVTDPNGTAVWSWYDGLGRKTAQLDGEQYLTKWSYDAEGNVLSETRYAAKYMGTPATGTVPSVSTNAADRITDFEYDLNGNRTKETRRGVAAWQVNATTGALSAAGTTDSVIDYTYNALGQVTQKTVMGLVAAGNTYDATGRLTSETRGAFTDAGGTPGVTPTTNYAYDAIGDLVGTTQLGTSSGTYTAADRTTTYRYGEGGRLLSTTDAEAATTTNPDDHIHLYFYDVAGRLRKDQYQREVNADTSVSDAALTTVTEAQVTAYDLAGRALTRAVYSAISGTFTRIDFASFEYNAYDQVTRQGSGANSGGAMYQAENRYDAAGRLVATNAGAGTDGGVWKVFGYDRNGNRTGAIASAGYATSSASSFAGLFAAVTGADLNGTWTLYDGRGSATQVIEEGRELAAGTSQTLNTWRTYNAFGEIASETNALGNTVTYTYNTMGRKVRAESPAVEITDETGAAYWIKPSEDYYYDLGGRLVATRDASEGAGGANYAHTGTSAGTATSKAANTGNLTTYVYLGATGLGGDQGLIAAEFHADGGKKEILYDRLGDARVIRDELYQSSSPLLHVEERSYNQLGQLVQVKHNRTIDGSGDAGRLVDNYVYDLLGQRLQHSNSQYGAAVIEKSAYDALGRVTRQADMLGQATVTAYAWDGALATSLGGSSLNLGGWTETTSYTGTTRTLVSKTDLYNREVWKSDLGGHVTTSLYDVAGRAISRTTGSTTQTFQWYSTGLVRQAAIWTGYYGASLWDHKQNDYTYDAVGQRLTDVGVHEGYRVYSTGFWSNTTDNFYESTSQTATYDGLGRLAGIVMTGTTYLPNASIAYKYDAAGNVRRTVNTHKDLDAQGQGSSSGTTEDYWFRYDAMNRVVTDQGMLLGTAGASGTVIVRRPADAGSASSQDIFYDAAGQRIGTAQTQYIPPSWQGSWYDGWYFPGAYLETRELYAYDGAGRLAEIRGSSAGAVDGESYTPSTVLPTAPSAPGSGARISAFTYDLMGRQLTQSDHDYGAELTFGAGPPTDYSSTNPVFSRSAVYDAAGKLTYDTTSAARSGATDVTSSSYAYTTGAGEYLLGAVGSVSATTYRNGSWHSSSTTTNTYEWWNGAMQGTIVYAQSGSSTFTTTLYYDGMGTIAFANIADGRPRRVYYRSNTECQVIHRGETDNTSGGDPHETWYRFGGREWGYVSNNGTSKLNAAASISERIWASGTGAFRNGSSSAISYSEFNQGYDPINSYSQGSAAGGYTVQRTGETLSGIAQALWGDSSLWYKLAEANGLSAETSLIEGQRLTVPAGVIRNTYNAGTVKPYNPADTLGNVQPTTPKPPPKPKGCGFAQIFLAIIAIAVTALLRVPIAKMFAGMGMGSAVGAGTALAGTAIGASSAAGIAGLAGAAMVGSVVSQGIGVATGIQDKFSFGAVAMAGIGAAVGGALGGIGLFDKIGSPFLADVARGAMGSAITQGIGVAAGLQDKFSWAGVAAAGIGNGVGLGLAREMGKTGGFFGLHAAEGSFASDTISTAASTLANAATRSAIEGSNFGDNIAVALPDAIGGVLGRALGRAGARVLANARSKGASPRIAYETVDPDDTVAGGELAGGGGGLSLNYSRLGLGLRPPTIKGVDVSLRTPGGNAAFDFSSDGVGLAPGWENYWKSIGLGQVSATSHGPALESIPEAPAIEIVVTADREKVRANRAAREREVAQQYNFASILGFSLDSTRVQSWRETNPLSAVTGGADASRQYMLADGSLFTGTSGAVDLLTQRRVFQERHNRLTTGGFASLAFGVADAAGASPETANFAYDLGGSADGLLLSGAALRGGSIRPFTGQNSLNIVNGENGVHGNSRNSARTTYLYELQTSDGQFLKYGISVNPSTRYSNSFMVGKRIDRITSGTRADMLALERQMVIANPGPLNKEPWAVKARGGN